MSQQQGPIIFNGRYELHRRLGRGGMAEVYLARDQMLDRAVAVKVLFPALATDPGFVERFRREAQSAAALNHPNIVGVYDWGEANGTYFIVMEYVEGESLAELIHAEGRLHPDRSAEIAADIAAALGFAHRNGGVIHRDVKPGNVLITRDGDVKVADFGIARAISESSQEQNLTKTGSVMGTATYFSPEQARGAAIDPRSDLYSLGCVIYELVLGHPPFAGDNAVAIAYKHVQEQAPPPRQVDPAIPDTLEAIILKCLAKNPANRYPTAQDLRADLRRYLDGARIMAEPVMAPPADPGATGLMAPTGYLPPTAAAGTTQWDQPYGDTYGDDGYGDDGYGEEEEEEKRSKVPLFILILLMLLLGGLLLFWLLSSGSDGGGGSEEIDVADVVGQPVEEARQTLEDAGFVVETEPVRDAAQLPQGFNDSTQVGTVVAQDPRPNAAAEEGDTVTLSVWRGTESVTVPDVEGMTWEEAQQALQDEGLSPSQETEQSDEVEEGQVIRTDPEANAEVDPDSLVSVFVSSGPDTVTVPNVCGQDPGTARSSLEGEGFTVGGDTEEPSDSVPAGTVIRVTPTDCGGDSAPNATLSLVVSSGPDQVSVPNVVGSTESAAQSILSSEGLSASVETRPTNDESQDGVVIRQSPSAGATASPGETVVIEIGDYREPDITVPTFPSTTSTTEPPEDGDGGD